MLRGAHALLDLRVDIADRQRRHRNLSPWPSPSSRREARRIATWPAAGRFDLPRPTPILASVEEPCRAEIGELGPSAAPDNLVSDRGAEEGRHRHAAVG